MAENWTPVAEYGARYEIDLVVPILEEAGIPVLVRGVEAGIWGGAFAGPTSRGITLLVPADRAEEARELLEEEEGDGEEERREREEGDGGGEGGG